MSLYETVRGVPHDAVVNPFDLVAFVLITSELIGEKRHAALAAWVARWFGGEKRVLFAVLSLIAAGTVTRALGVPLGHWRALALLSVAGLLLSLFTLLGRSIRTAPSRRLMLGLGAALFIAARMTAIFFVL